MIKAALLAMTVLGQGFDQTMLSPADTDVTRDAAGGMGASSQSEDHDMAARRCFDVAVAARILDQRYLPAPPRRADDLLGHVPIRITLKVEQSVPPRSMGGRVEVTSVAHVKFNHKIKRAIFFLKKTDRDRYATKDIIPWLVTDDRDRRVMLLSRPIEADAVFPYSYIPPDYERLVRPVSYRYKDAWWFEPGIPKRDPADYSWGHLKDGWIVADRGILVSDLLKAAEPYPCRR